VTLGYTMKFSQCIGNLKNPNFVLDTPRYIQFFINFIWLVFTFFMYFWAYKGYFDESIDVMWFASFMSVTMSIFLIHPKLWRRWISFAADQSGVYIVNFFTGDYTLIPWCNVVGIRIGVMRVQNDRLKTVILTLELDDVTWCRITGKSPVFINRKSSEFGIGNNLRNVENTYQEIRKIQSLANLTTGKL